MKRTSHIAGLLVAMALLCLGTAACSDDSCYDNGSSLPLAEFYIGHSKQTVPELTIKGIGAPGDSLLADSMSLNEIYLPLRVSMGSTSYALDRKVYINGVSTLMHDTIAFDYQPIEFFHSIECGAMYNFDIKRVTATSHAIDSVVVLTPLVTNSRTPALRIYFTDFTL